MAGAAASEVLCRRRHGVDLTDASTPMRLEKPLHALGLWPGDLWRACVRHTVRRDHTRGYSSTTKQPSSSITSRYRRPGRSLSRSSPHSRATTSSPSRWPASPSGPEMIVLQYLADRIGGSAALNGHRLAQAGRLVQQQVLDRWPLRWPRTWSRRMPSRTALPRSTTIPTRLARCSIPVARP